MEIEKNVIEVEVKDKFYNVEYAVTYSFDGAYGADADGKRGVPRYIVDEIEVIEITDEEGNYLKDKELFRLVAFIAKGLIWDII